MQAALYWIIIITIIFIIIIAIIITIMIIIINNLSLSNHLQHCNTKQWIDNGTI